MMNKTFVRTDELPDVLTVRELSRILRSSINTAYQLVRQKKVKSIRMGRQYRIPRWAVVEYLEQGKMNVLEGVPGEHYAPLASFD